MNYKKGVIKTSIYLGGEVAAILEDVKKQYGIPKKVAINALLDYAIRKLMEGAVDGDDVIKAISEVVKSQRRLLKPFLDELQLRIEVENLYEEVKKAGKKDVRKYKAILGRLEKRFGKKSILLDEGLARKLEFIYRRLFELERGIVVEPVREVADVVEELERLYEEYRSLGVLNVGRKRELRKKLEELIGKAKELGIDVSKYEL
ncbi:hypothetical protein [Archaeoglobus profundus]|nr:hypothetical protein [Archaeoglobus profundus]